MLKATIVTTEEELLQIHRLNGENLKQNLDREAQLREGFVTWLYPVALLEKMHHLAPSIIVKDGELVVGYALSTLREASDFHQDLQTMFSNLAQVQYKGRPLSSYQFYCMGQICVAGPYRGQGIVRLLYEEHQKRYENHYDFILTEISTSNTRSLQAHEKIGFRTIYTYRDAVDEWDVVVWDWGRSS